MIIGPGSILPDLLATKGGPAIAQTAAPRTFTTDSDIYSVFLQATWNVHNDLRLSFGGRYTQEEKDGARELTFTDLNGTVKDVGGVDGVLGELFGIERHSLNGNREEENFSPSILAEYNLNEEILLYANVSQGSKSGGFDARSNADPAGTFGGTFEYEDEKATSFELGAKTSLLNGAAEVNYALFFTEYKDLQVSIFDGSLGFNVGNAAKAETYGLEIDGRWAVTDSFILSGALAFLDFEFTDYPNGQCNFDPTPNSPDLCDYKGLTNQYVADWSGSISGDYYMPINDTLQLRSALDLVFSDDYNPTQTLDPGMDQDGYVKVNARIAVSDANDTWEVALIGKNLTDEKIMTYGNQTPLSGLISGTASRYAFYERERSVAIQGVYRF